MNFWRFLRLLFTFCSFKYHSKFFRSALQIVKSTPAAKSQSVRQIRVIAELVAKLSEGVTAMAIKYPMTKYVSGTHVSSMGNLFLIFAIAKIATAVLPKKTLERMGEHV